MKFGIPLISLSAASLVESMTLSSGPLRGGGAGLGTEAFCSGCGGAFCGAGGAGGCGGAASASGARCSVGRESSASGGFTDAVVLASPAVLSLVLDVVGDE